MDMNYERVQDEDGTYRIAVNRDDLSREKAEELFDDLMEGLQELDELSKKMAEVCSKHELSFAVGDVFCYALAGAPFLGKDDGECCAFKYTFGACTRDAVLSLVSFTNKISEHCKE